MDVSLSLGICVLNTAAIPLIETFASISRATKRNKFSGMDSPSHKLFTFVFMVNITKLAALNLAHTCTHTLTERDRDRDSDRDRDKER